MRLLLFLGLVTLLVNQTYAQDTTGYQPPYNGPSSATSPQQAPPMPTLGQNPKLKLKLNDDGSRFLQATVLGQIWFRYNQSNPGSTYFGYQKPETYDIGLRRVRVQLFGQVTDRVFFYSQVGLNNVDVNSVRKQGLFLHDLMGEYALIPKHLHIGGGISAWSGLSRFSSPSVGTIMTLDAPIFEQSTNDVTDQFLRKFSIHVKGKLGKLDYRVMVTDPMPVQTASTVPPTLKQTGVNVATFARNPPQAQYNGYLQWQFWDQESNLTPYMVGTYLGAKRVFNLGAGFVYQPKAMYYVNSYSGTAAGLANVPTGYLPTGGVAQDSSYRSLALFSVDAYLDAPLNKQTGTALTLYGVFQNLNFGPNYVRFQGVMNPATGVDTKVIPTTQGNIATAGGTANGGGNYGSAFAMLGTGNTAYAQAGFLLPKHLLGSQGTLQAFVACQYAKWERFNDPMWMYEAGFNWLLSGHNAKLSLEYQSHTTYVQGLNGVYTTGGRRGMAVAQLQIFIQ